MKKYCFLLLCCFFLIPKSSQASCTPPEIVTLVQESGNQFLLNWIDFNGENTQESATILINIQLCSGISIQEAYEIFPLVHSYFDFTTDPDWVIASITAVVVYTCEDGSTANPSIPAILEFDDCAPCVGIPDVNIPEIGFSCDRAGLLCVVIDGVNQADEASSIYQVCDIGGNDTAGACYNLSTLPDGASSLQVTLCEWRTGGCENQACCVVVDVAVPVCEDNCPELPFTIDWCCSFDGTHACLCLHTEDGTIPIWDINDTGYWVSDMNIPGNCITNLDLPPVFTPVTLVINNRDNTCSQTVTIPGPDCWTIDDDGGNFQDGGVIGLNAHDAHSSNENTIELFPNPATEIITLENSFNEAINYEIIDAQGKYLKRGNMKVGDTQLSIQDYEPGVYFLKYKNTQHETRTLRFVKI